MKLKAGKLVDPDGGINIAKKKAQLRLYENISPESLKDFLAKGIQMSFLMFHTQTTT